LKLFCNDVEEVRVAPRTTVLAERATIISIRVKA
jgi:hypothetical protein